MRPRVAVFASGTGRSFANLCRRARDGRLAAEIALLVADRACPALDLAGAHAVPAVLLDWRSHAGSADWSAAAFARAAAAGAELVVLAGFLRRLKVPATWSGRVLNIHPALLPEFGGQGMWGERVHRAVLAAGRRESGCSVHYVDDEYDHGPLLLQWRVPVLPGDDAARLAARVFEAECEALPEAITRHFAERRGAHSGSA
jgi:phosphoribosylglycinamide formyltransferase-1